MLDDAEARRPLRGEPPPARVAVFRALQLGDLLCAVPALRALRAAAPAARITLVGLPWARCLPDRFPAYLDDFLPFPGHPALPERTPDPAARPGFLAAARAARFDLALQMHGSGGVTNGIVAELGARNVAGCYPPAGWPPGGLFIPYPEGEPEVRRCLRLVEALGAPARGEQLEFPLTATDTAALMALPEAHALPSGRFVCVHPGARAESRRWPPRRFAAVADALAARGLVVALTGSAAEAGLTAAVAGLMHAPALDLAGRTDLGALAALLARARLLVSNDTGVSHLAAALGTPSVVIFSGSDPRRWAPHDGARHRALFHTVAGRRCPALGRAGDHPCALAVGPPAVLAAADALLAATERAA